MRRDLVAALVGGAVVLVLAGSVAWAAIPGEGGAYTACMLKNVGTVRLIDKSLPPSHLMSHCKPALEMEISWNQRGLPGPAGTDGADGADGEPFSGTFTSPNGEYSISVTDSGITIAHGASNSITLTGDDLAVRSEDIDIRSDLTSVLQAGTTATVDAGTKFTLNSSGSGDVHTNGVLDLEGSVININ
jgi:hypothetical protein